MHKKYSIIHLSINCLSEQIWYNRIKKKVIDKSSLYTLGRHEWEKIRNKKIYRTSQNDLFKILFTKTIKKKLNHSTII